MRLENEDGGRKIEYRMRLEEKGNWDGVWARGKRKLTKGFGKGEKEINKRFWKGGKGN